MSLEQKINFMNSEKANPDKVKQKSNALYNDARKLLYQGKPELANDLIFKATRLEKTIS